MFFFRKLKIRNKLLLGYSALFIMAILMGSSIIYYLIKSNIEQTIEQQLANSSDAVRNMVRTAATTAIKTHLRDIARVKHRQVAYFYEQYRTGKLSEAEAKARACGALLSEKIGKTGYIFVWDIRNAPKSIPLAVHPYIQGKDVAYVDFVQAGAKLKNGYIEYEWKNPQEKKERKKSMFLSYFAPWRWVIAAASYREEFLDQVDINDFKEFITPLRFGRSGYTFVLDVDGNVIFHPKLSGNYYDASDPDGFKFIREICTRKNGSIVYRWKNPDESYPRKKLAVYRFIPEFNWIVATAGYYEEFYEPLKSVREIIIVIMIGTLVLVLPLTLWLSSTITSPIKLLMDRFSGGIAGDLTVRMKVDSDDEVGALSGYFNSFMDKLEEYSRSLQNEIGEKERTTRIIERQKEHILAQYEDMEAINLELNSIHDRLIQSHYDLSEEKERLMTTLRSIGDGVIAADRNGTIRMLNRIAEEIVEFPQEEVLGRRMGDLVTMVNAQNGDQYGDPVDEVLCSGTKCTLTGDPVLVTRAGRHKYILANAAPLFDKAGVITGAVLILSDITERRNMEKELMKTLKIESLGIFAGGIAHDFNNLLTAIVGNISLAMQYFERDDELYAILDDAQKASISAKDLTQQLLTFSKGGEPVKKPAPLKEILATAVDFILSGSDIRSEYAIPDDLWNAHIDTGQINQVIYNIILNARQAMPQGGTIRISAENFTYIGSQGLPLDAGNYIKLTIIDEGPGIPEEHMKNIFDPYFTTKENGIGLGLAISHSIIRKHGGHVTVHSGKGEGSTFTLYLPTTAESDVHPKETSSRDRFGNGAVLVMDDEDPVLNIARKMLVRLGYDVATAHNGEEAVEKYRRAKEDGAPFRAVIMDLTIPGGMGGRKTIEKLREYDPAIVAFVSSGYSNDPVMANYRDYGFAGVIAKPYLYDELADVLYRHLAS